MGPAIRANTFEMGHCEFRDNIDAHGNTCPSKRNSGKPNECKRRHRWVGAPDCWVCTGCKKQCEKCNGSGKVATSAWYSLIKGEDACVDCGGTGKTESKQ